eukprot:8376764-Alexandrium_andersonii.AAC.1
MECAAIACPTLSALACQQNDGMRSSSSARGRNRRGSRARGHANDGGHRLNCADALEPDSMKRISGFARRTAATTGAAREVDWNPKLHEALREVP